MNHDNLRDQGKGLDDVMSQRQWINTLPPIAQAKLRNLNEIDTGVEPLTLEKNSKYNYLVEYDQEICREPELYKKHLDRKKQQEKNGTEAVNLREDCTIS